MVLVINKLGLRVEVTVDIACGFLWRIMKDILVGNCDVIRTMGLITQGHKS